MNLKHVFYIQHPVFLIFNFTFCLTNLFPDNVALFFIVLFCFLFTYLCAALFTNGVMILQAQQMEASRDQLNFWRRVLTVCYVLILVIDPIVALVYWNYSYVWSIFFLLLVAIPVNNTVLNSIYERTCDINESFKKVKANNRIMILLRVCLMSYAVNDIIAVITLFNHIYGFLPTTAVYAFIILQGILFILTSFILLSFEVVYKL